MNSKNRAISLTKFRVDLRVVLYREDGDWFAHCLEFDIIGDGKTPKSAFNRMMKAIDLQIAATVELKNPHNLFSPADAKYFEMFAQGDSSAEFGGFRAKHAVIEGVETRQYSGQLALAS